MPVMRCRRRGRPGYKWGQSGKCYTYSPGDETARQTARARARRQGRAIAARTRNAILTAVGIPAGPSGGGEE